MDQHAQPDRTTPLQSVWSMVLSVSTVSLLWRSLSVAIQLCVGVLEGEDGLTLNCHSTQFHWPCTLEWGCSVEPCMLIDCRIKFFSPIPNWYFKNHLLYCTKSYIHHLLTYLAFLINKLQLYQECCHNNKYFNSILRKDFLLIVQRIKLGIIWWHIWKEHAQLTPYKPHNYCIAGNLREAEMFAIFATQWPIAKICFLAPLGMPVLPQLELSTCFDKHGSLPYHCVEAKLHAEFLSSSHFRVCTHVKL